MELVNAFKSRRPGLRHGTARSAAAPRAGRVVEIDDRPLAQPRPWKITRGPTAACSSPIPGRWTTAPRQARPDAPGAAPARAARASSWPAGTHQFDAHGGYAGSADSRRPESVLPANDARAAWRATTATGIGSWKTSRSTACCSPSKIVSASARTSRKTKKTKTAPETYRRYQLPQDRRIRHRKAMPASVQFRRCVRDIARSRPCRVHRSAEARCSPCFYDLLGMRRKSTRSSRRSSGPDRYRRGHSRPHE